MISPETFEIAFPGYALQGDRMRSEAGRDAFYLHGAGQSSRAGAYDTRELLQRHGVGTSAIDYIGHGETGGPLAASSLHCRLDQARALVRARHVSGPLTLIGSSMGGYDAIKLSERLPVRSLILVVPAVFTPAAFDKPFGPAFSAVIRRHRSWDDTDAWDILSAFRGRLLVIAAEQDAVIPAEIPERIVASARAAEHKELIVPRGTLHSRVFSVIREDPRMLSHVMAAILTAIDGAEGRPC
jgi:pimeloyl-ACP methyl ester carboxylesterase